MATKKKKTVKILHIKKATKTVRQELFLKAFSRTGIVADGVKAAHIERQTVYDWKDNDPTFKDRYNEAERMAVEVLEKEAVRRAARGTLKPVFYQGTPCGKIREFSDTLLIFLMKGRDRGKWGDKPLFPPGPIGVELTGKDGNAINIDGKLTLEKAIEKMRPDEVEAELARMEAEEKALREEEQGESTSPLD